MLGVVNFAQFAGVVVLAPWSGRAADHFDRRHVAFATQTGAFAVALTLMLVSAFDVATAPVVIGLAVLAGATLAFAAPALNALVTTLVDRDRLPAAVAMNSATYNLGRVIGPVLAALVIDKLGVTWSFAFAAVLSLALILALFLVRPFPGDETPGAGIRFRESLALVRRTPRLAVLLLAVAAISLSADPVMTLGPAFATQAFHRPDTAAGFLVGAFGAGAVAAAVLIGGHPGRSLRRVALTLALTGAGIAAFGIAPSFAVAIPLLVVAGFGFLGTNAAASTRLQLEVDERQRGRVMALWSIAFIGVRPLGSLIDGTIAAAASVHAAALVMAAPSLLLAVALLVALRRR